VVAGHGDAANELRDLVPYGGDQPPGCHFKLGERPAYVSTFAEVPGGTWKHLSLRECAAHGLDMHFVDMVESIEYARFDGISTKNRTGGRKIKKVAEVRMAVKMPQGNGTSALATFSLSWYAPVSRLIPHERDKMQASVSENMNTYLLPAIEARHGVSYDTNGHLS
jgi:hypothetical protein